MKWDRIRSLKESRQRRDERKAREWEEETGANAYRLSDMYIPHLFAVLALPVLAAHYA